MALAQAFAKAVQDHVHGVAALTMPTGHKVKLLTVAATATAGGTEVSGGSYPAGGIAITFGAATTATPSVSANSAVVSQTSMPACTVVGIDVTSGSGTRIEYGPLDASKTLGAGDTITFAIGTISSALQ